MLDSEIFHSITYQNLCTWCTRSQTALHYNFLFNIQYIVTVCHRMIFETFTPNISQKNCTSALFLLCNEIWLYCTLLKCSLILNYTVWKRINNLFERTPKVQNALNYNLNHIFSKPRLYDIVHLERNWRPMFSEKNYSTVLQNIQWQLVVLYGNESLLDFKFH